MPHAPAESLFDILELIGRIERQIMGVTREQFLADGDIQDATAYRLLAIGEAARSLGADLTSRYESIPWRQIVAMRNILAHEYFSRESDIIWETVQAGLTALTEACRTELIRLGFDPDRRGGC